MSCNISDIVADETLFQEIQRGDEKAFDVLFLKYYPSLCAYAQRFVEYDDGQEIVQDVMVWLRIGRCIRLRSLRRAICLKL